MEASVQMKLYTLTKREFLLVFTAFFCCFFVILMIGVAGPPVLGSVDQRLGVEWDRRSTSVQSPFNITIEGQSAPGWSVFNQELWLECLITNAAYHLKEKGSRYLSFNLHIEEIEGLDSDGRWQPIFPGLRKYSHFRRLKCAQQCEKFVVLHLGYVSHYQYKVLFSLDELSNASIVGNMLFKWHYYNVQFTQLQIWFRFIFVVATFASVFLLIQSLRNFAVTDWSIEQKWMSILLVLLILYDDPLFPLRFLAVGNFFSRLLEVFFETTFLAALLLYWLCSFHGIRENTRHFVTFYLPKLGVVGFSWLVALTVLAWEEFNSVSDPAYQAHLDTSGFKALRITLYVSMAFYLCLLFYHFLRSFAEINALPYFGLRLKFLTSLMLIVLIVSVTIVMVRFGSLALQPNFISSPLPPYSNSAEFLALIGLINFYLLTITYVYSPSRNALQESLLKDNPSSSMLNNSEDEITYTDGDEEDVHLSRFQGNF